MDMMMRLANLSQQVHILKNKTEQNRVQAKEANELSYNATQAASELTKVHLLSTNMSLQFVCNIFGLNLHVGYIFVCMCLHQDLSHVETRYKELKDKVDALGGTAAGNFSQKALDMKNEAEDLLKKANKDMETLKSTSL